MDDWTHGVEARRGWSLCLALTATRARTQVTVRCRDPCSCASPRLQVQSDTHAVAAGGTL